MTSRDFSYTALRITALICFARAISAIPGILIYYHRVDTSTLATSLFLDAALFNLALLVIAVIFWTKAKLLSAIFALDKVSEPAKSELSDWYNLGCILIGIFLVATAFGPLLIRVEQMALSKSPESYLTIVIAYILQIVIGLLLIFKKHGLLSLIKKARTR